MVFVYLAVSMLGLVGAALFAGFENGMVSIRKARLDHAVAQGSWTAKLIKILLDRPAMMLATVLLGTNLSHSTIAVFFDEFVKAAVSAGFNQLSRSPFVLSAAAVAVPTIVILIFCEITPKVWFRQHPFPRCRLAVPPVFLFFVVAFPVVWVFTALVHLMHRLFPRKFGSDVVLMREDFRLMLRESEEDGLISEESRILLENSLKHDQHSVRAVMVPRDAVQAISAAATLAEMLIVARKHEISRFPVFDPDNADEWIGLVSIYDAIYRVPRDKWADTTVREYMRPLVAVSEGDDGTVILQTARKARTPLLIAIDDDGRQSGIVTPTDIVRPLFGDLDL